MAGEAEQRALTLTIDKFLKGTLDAVSQEVVEWYWLLKRAKQGTLTKQGGPGLSWNLRTKRGQTTGFGRNKVLEPVAVDRNIQARLINGGYAIAELVHLTDEWENRSPEALANIVGDTLEGARGDLFNLMGDAFYTQQDPDGFPGVHDLLVDTGTVANVDVDANPNFAANLSDGLQDPFDSYSQDPVPALDAMVNACIKGSQGGKMRTAPDVGFMEYEKFTVVTQSVLRQARWAKDTKSADFGWDDNFKYRGVTFFPSKKSPADIITLIDSGGITYRTPAPSVVYEKRDSNSMPMAQYFFLLLYGLLQVKSPRNHGKFLVDQTV